MSGPEDDPTFPLTPDGKARYWASPRGDGRWAGAVRGAGWCEHRHEDKSEAQECAGDRLRGYVMTQTGEPQVPQGGIVTNPSAYNWPEG